MKVGPKSLFNVCDIYTLYRVFLYHGKGKNSWRKVGIHNKQVQDLNNGINN